MICCVAAKPNHYHDGEGYHQLESRGYGRRGEEKFFCVLQPLLWCRCRQEAMIGIKVLLLLLLLPRTAHFNHLAVWMPHHGISTIALLPTSNNFFTTSSCATAGGYYGPEDDDKVRGVVPPMHAHAQLVV